MLKVLYLMLFAFYGMQCSCARVAERFVCGGQFISVTPEKTTALASDQDPSHTTQYHPNQPNQFIFVTPEKCVTKRRDGRPVDTSRN